MNVFKLTERYRFERSEICFLACFSSLLEAQGLLDLCVLAAAPPNYLIHVALWVPDCDYDQFKCVSYQCSRQAEKKK